MITTNEEYELTQILPRVKADVTGNVVDKVTCGHIRRLQGRGKRVALLDFGAKQNIARSLHERGCDVTVYPAHTSAEQILKDKPDGIMLSNGPGDPKECGEIIQELKKLYESDTPIFAICLGHQLMALANGADTHKNEIWTPWRQPSGERFRDWKGVHFFPESRVCGGHRTS